jgi:hypothetical protein
MVVLTAALSGIFKIHNSTPYSADNRKARGKLEIVILNRAMAATKTMIHTPTGARSSRFFLLVRRFLC